MAGAPPLPWPMPQPPPPPMPVPIAKAQPRHDRQAIQDVSMAPPPPVVLQQDAVMIPVPPSPPTPPGGDPLGLQLVAIPAPRFGAGGGRTGPGQNRDTLLRVYMSECDSQLREIAGLQNEVRRLRGQRNDAELAGTELYAENAVLTSITQNLHEAAIQSDRQWNDRIRGLESAAHQQMAAQASEIHSVHASVANREREMQQELSRFTSAVEEDASQIAAQKLQLEFALEASQAAHRRELSRIEHIEQNAKYHCCRDVCT